MAKAMGIQQMESTDGKGSRTKSSDTWQPAAIICSWKFCFCWERGAQGHQKQTAAKVMDQKATGCCFRPLSTPQKAAKRGDFLKFHLTFPLECLFLKLNLVFPSDGIS